MKPKSLTLIAATLLGAIATVPALASSSSPPTETTINPPSVATNTMLTELIMPNAVPNTVAKANADPDWKTIAMTHGALGDGFLVDSSVKDGGGSGYATTTLAASSDSSTAAPAIGYSVTDLAKLSKPDRTAVAFITA